MKSIIFFQYLLILFACLNISAQPLQFNREIVPFPVYDQNGDLYEFSFLGGVNKPVIQFLDINASGAPDLFLLDQDQPDQLIYFRNTGTAASPQFDWVTDKFQNLSAGAWFKFRDVDDDNDYDLYSENPFGNIRFYRNTGTPSLPTFALSLDTLMDVTGQPIQTDGFSIPEWSDINCDNDADLLLGRLNGRISHYDNIGLDLNNLPRFSFVTDTFQGINIQTGGGEKTVPAAINLHGANSLTFVDIDNDLDNDLFWGDFFASSIIHLKNYGSCPSPLFQQDSIIELYPPNQPLMTAGYNVPHFYDIDSDNDFDLFVSILGGALSPTSNITDNFLFYRNNGNSNQASFNLETRQFINAIDIGQNSIPALVDIDADGDLDIFLANQEDLDSPEALNSRLYFYENQGTPTQPQFTLADTNFLHYDKRFDVNYAPVFSDIDADNDFDLVVGKFDGKLSYWRNDGTASTPNFVLVSENYAGIDIGSNSMPTFVDIDADLDLDLFIGEFNGNINYYRNNGSPANPNFQLDTTHYFGIEVGLSEFSYPHFTDFDRDGDFDLFIGSATRGTLFYRNVGNSQSANFIPDNSLQLPVYLRNTPNFADMDSDGDVDLLSGFYGGGMIYYQNLEFVSIHSAGSPKSSQPNSIELLANYPNPFNPVTVISWLLAVDSPVTLTICNLRGQKVTTLLSAPLLSGLHSIEWDASHKASGIYFYRLEAGPQVATRKMILMR